MNRAQRRHPGKDDRTSPSSRPDREQTKPSPPPDEPDVRAKSSGHGKKTADKWNQ
jgi:hypothetical protein